MTDTERLEHARQVLQWERDDTPVFITSDNLRWLIGRAEACERYEKALKVIVSINVIGMESAADEVEGMVGAASKALFPERH